MISIQKATPTDALIIAEIGARSLWESHGHSSPAADFEGYVSSAYSSEQITKELADPWNIFHTIYYKGQPAGFSKIILNSPHALIRSPTITKLERLYLLKEFYGLNLGSSLFEWIIRLSKEEGQTGIWLNVWTANDRAISFYEKKGFTIIGKADFRISSTHSNPNHVMYLSY